MNIVHVFKDWTPTQPDALRRNREAFETWHLLKALQLPFKGKRSSKHIGDAYDMPYAKDMINAAFASGTEEICVVTNNDIRFDEKLLDSIVNQCSKVGCWWAFRVDKPDGRTDGGADCFAMNRKWWGLHEHQFPDLLFGYRWWDNIMRRLMIWSGCEEQPRLYYHEPHPGVETRMKSPGERYNQVTAEKWLKENDEPENQGYPTDLQKKIEPIKKSLVERIKNVIIKPKSYEKHPIVWVFAICKNEAEMLPYFLRHYSTFCEKIVIWDEQSTDGTRELIKACSKAELKDWPFKGLDDEKFTNWVNSVSKVSGLNADWVIFADIDELLYHPNPLKALAEADGNVVVSKGYALISESYSENKSTTQQLYDIVRTGVRQYNYDKRIIWRPESNIQHTIGRHTYGNDWPKFKGKLATNVEFKLLHCHHVWGVEDTAKRNQRDYDNAVDKKFAWNYSAEHNSNPNQPGSVAWVENILKNNLLIKDVLMDGVSNSKPLRKINLGCGGNILEGWSNHDSEIDISKPLPFAGGRADYVFAEHVVEHISHQQAWNFFEECFRILKPQGTLRVAVPDVCKMWCDMTPEYRQAVKNGGHGDGTSKAAIRSAIFNHGHQAGWSQEMLCTILTAIGFFANPCNYGESKDSELRGIEGHGKVVGEDIARVETSIVEARKPDLE